MTYIKRWMTRDKTPFHDHPSDVNFKDEPAVTVNKKTRTNPRFVGNRKIVLPPPEIKPIQDRESPPLFEHVERRTDKQMKATSKSDPARTYKGAGKSVSGVVKTPKTDWSSPKHTKPKPKPKAGMNGGVMIPKKKDSALKWLNTPFGRF